MQGSHGRVVIVGADGLRPDLFDPDLMPNAAALIAGGTWFADHHAVYPSHTRVNASSLATGTSPGRHGIVANTMLVEDARDDHIIDTGQYEHLDALAASQGRAQLVTSLSDILAARGERLAVAGTGSAGSNVLWTFNQRGRIVNPSSAFGIADLYDLRDKLGPVPDRAATSADRSAYATSAVTDLYLPDPSIRVMTLWLAEPDSALHRYGLGSPESIAAMRDVDFRIGEVVATLDRLGIRDQTDIVVISDHGHSTVRTHRTLREYLADARRDLGGHLPDLATASDFIYAMPGSTEPTVAQLAPLVEWLDAQPWVDVMAGGLDGTARLPGVIPLRALWNGETNARRPLLAVSPSWSEAVNEFGVPGTVSALTTQSALRSSHGSLSPYEMHATLVASGPSFREGMVSTTPTSAMDLVPTILSIFGIDASGPIDGRILTEAMANGDGTAPAVETTVLAPDTPGARPRSIVLHRIAGTTVVHGSAQSTPRL
ncbi:MAG TPA: alkaline phosphatase family protein, partial [Thermomicrobiales bacterium]|nr:alkaline phosphatase family protein [Thermomicrobiales bacterium]